VAQGAAAPFQECSNLGELAVWLGVGKVRHMDALLWFKICG
jgi:hypothetical protein